MLLSERCSAKWNHYLKEEERRSIDALIKVAQTFFERRQSEGLLWRPNLNTDGGLDHLGGIASTVSHLTLFMRMNPHLPAIVAFQAVPQST